MIDAVERTLTRIDLELAREPNRPEGDPADRYTIVAPLDAAGRIDAARWREVRDRCRVFRQQDEAHIPGRLVHGPGGRWDIQYDKDALPAETGFRFRDERFQAGEYVSIERDGKVHVYRVVSARPL